MADNSNEELTLLSISEASRSFRQASAGLSCTMCAGTVDLRCKTCLCDIFSCFPCLGILREAELIVRLPRAEMLQYVGLGRTVMTLQLCSDYQYRLDLLKSAVSYARSGQVPCPCRDDATEVRSVYTVVRHADGLCRRCKALDHWEPFVRRSFTPGCLLTR